MKAVVALVPLMIAAWLVYLLATPSSDCEVGVQCNSNGWNSSQTIALIIIVLLVGFSIWRIAKTFKKPTKLF